MHLVPAHCIADLGQHFEVKQVRMRGGIKRTLKIVNQSDLVAKPSDQTHWFEWQFFSSIPRPAFSHTSILERDTRDQRVTLERTLEGTLESTDHSENISERTHVPWRCQTLENKFKKGFQD